MPLPPIRIVIDLWGGILQGRPGLWYGGFQRDKCLPFRRKYRPLRIPRIVLGDSFAPVFPQFSSPLCCHPSRSLHDHQSPREDPIIHLFTGDGLQTAHSTVDIRRV